MRPFLAFVLCAAFLAGCVEKLTADFDADTVGEQPEFDLPGPPNGDTVTVSGGGSPVVASGAISNTTNVLRFEGANQPTAVFFTAPINDGSRPVYLMWDGEVHVSATVDFNIYGGVDDAILRLRLENGNFIVNSLNEGFYFANTPQKLLVSLFPDGRYMITGLDGFNFAGASCNNEPELICGNLENPDDYPSFHVQLSVLLRDASRSAYYSMDNVRITQFKPQ